jgi:hypothetical protein
VTDRQVLVEVEHAFGADPSSMVIMMMVPEDLLLMLPDLRAADRVFNKGLPLVGSGFTLFFKRWTWLILAYSSELPIPVTVELYGIMTHAWDKATAQHILSDTCWVVSLLPETAVTRDLSVLRVTAWSWQPELISQVVDLLVPEPALAQFDEVKHDRVYPVSVS